MTDTIPTCVNHPRVETRLACSSCGDPICVDCMRQSAVGQKCPSCARLPRSARARGKPQHYVKAIGAGLGVAAAGGTVLALMLATIGFGFLILSGLLGLAVGRAVSWGAQRQSQQPFAGIAVGCGVMGVALGLVIVFRTPVPPSPIVLLGYPIAGWLALRGLRG
jgi:hypothetical protein